MDRIPRRIYALFFLSGVAALLYQVVWTKQLANQFGVTAHAISTTVSVFMLGLALGSWLFGRAADRVKRPLVGYLLLELGIGASALASLALLRGVERLLASSWLPELSGPGFAALRTAGTFLVLILPSLLMGGTLPMLAKELVASGGEAGRRVGRLYAVNALGGAAGCLLAGFATIGWLGLRGSILAGAALNALAAALAYALVRRPALPAGSDPARPEPAEAHAARPSTRMLAALFLAGLGGLAVEVVWTRMLLLNLGSTAQSFAAMLAVYLFGLALGSLATSRIADRVDPVRGYGLTLALVGMSIVLCMALWATLHPGSQDAARWIVDRLPRPLRGNAAFRLAICLLQCSLLLLLPTLLMGCAVPFAARCFGRIVPEAGRRLGTAFTLNALGSMMGPLLCGFWWLPSLGVQRTLLLCGAIPIATGAVLALPSLRGGRRWALAGISLAFLLGSWGIPADFALARTEQRTTGKLLHAEEDISGSVAVVEVRAGAERFRQLMVGTTSMISDGFSCRRYTRLLGHLPMLLHHDPRDAMVICLGSGMTLSAVAAHPDVTSIDCAELSPGVVRAARGWFGEANGGVLGDPRVRVIVNDGRTQLLVSRKRYDVITLEPPPPYNDGVASLYSREFYELCRSRLRPGGMVSQWIPYHGASLPQIRSLVATMQAVFPHTTLWELFDGREYCVIGRLDDSAIPFERTVARLSRPAVLSHLGEVGIRRPEDLFACFVAGPRGVAAFAAGASLVTDDLPGIGYDLAAENLIAPRGRSFQRAIQEAGLATAAYAESPEEYLEFASEHLRQQFLERLRPVKTAWRMHALSLRLGTLPPSEYPSVFRQAFTAPIHLEPENPYYQYANRRGIYHRARERQVEFLRGGG